MANIRGRRSFAGARRGGRKLGSWSFVTSGTSWTALGAASAILDAFFVPLLPDQTILRVRGLLSVKSDQDAATEQINGAFGMMIVTEQATSIGVSAIPFPVTDGGDDKWFVWQPFSHALEFADATGISEPAQTSYVLDSKAMRKLDDSERIAIMIENQSAAAGIRYHYLLRVLTRIGRV